jgi:hypothetical protein
MWSKLLRAVVRALVDKDTNFASFSAAGALECGGMTPLLTSQNQKAA